MNLPVGFLEKMKGLMSADEFREFTASFDLPRHYGLRVNTLKTDIDSFSKISPFKFEPIPWTKDGFYISGEDSPGKHPYYNAGLYYVQEPSAMLPAEVLAAQPGEKILDLCAAPGGKTLQMASSMKGRGLLFSNDINETRAKALVKNIEMHGVRNAIVTVEDPAVLAGKYAGYFDAILIDAPCSGEGMFRKDWEAVKSWGKYKSEMCCKAQANLLRYADLLLRPGGRIVYSTCTFSPEEDEIVIAEFVQSRENYTLENIPHEFGIESGRPEWCGGFEEIKKTARLWPHRLRGEGHFTARLRKIDFTAQNNENDSGVDVRLDGIDKSGGSITETLNVNRDSNLLELAKEGGSWGFEKSNTQTSPFEIAEFCSKNLNIDLKGWFNVKGSAVYVMPEKLPDLSGIKAAKFGWYLGDIKDGRFNPSNSMIMGLEKQDIKNVLDLDASSIDAVRYLRGETLILEGSEGLTGVCIDGFPVGWGKQAGGTLKNLYPKGWRRMS